MNQELLNLIHTYAPALAKGAASGAAAGLTVDLLAWRKWAQAIDLTNPDWADELRTEITGYKWRLACGRALAGALIGSAVAASPAIAATLGMAGFFGLPATKAGGDSNP